MIMLVALSVGVSAATHLAFTDVDVKVGSKTSKNLKDGDTISDEAAPGDKVDFKIKVKNNFTDAEDVKIEDIELIVTIEGFDEDGEDIDEEAKTFDLKADDDKSSTVSFTVPLEIGEGSYDVTIDVDGDLPSGNNNGSQKNSMKLTLEVEKENHELRISRASLSPETVRCARSVQLSASVLNTGSEDEDSATLTITNPELGVDFRDVFDVAEGDFDDDMTFSKLYSFTVPKDTDAGVYPITLKATYNDNRDTVSRNVDLTVQDCTVAETAAGDSGSSEQTTTPPKSTPQTTTVVVTQPTTTVPSTTTAEIIQPTTTIPTAQQPTATESAPQEKSLFESSSFLVGLLVLEVLVVVIVIAVIAYFVRKS